jgi:hypothetical protein
MALKAYKTQWMNPSLLSSTSSESGFDRLGFEVIFQVDGSVLDVELLADVFAVGFYRVQRYVQRLGDGFAGQALFDHPGNAGFGLR